MKRLCPGSFLRALLAVLACGVTATRAGELEPELAYRFTLHPQPVLRVDVQVHAAGSPEGETTLEVSENWGGVTAAGEDIADLRVTTWDGRPLVVQHPTPWRWTVRHALGEPLVYFYSIHANPYQDDPDPRTHYRPIVTSGLVHWIGELALVRPKHLDDGTPRRVAFEWEDFDLPGWKVASSFGVGARPLRLDVPLQQVREALFLAGKLEIFERSVHAQPVAIALAGKGWRFAPAQFADLATRVVELERGFFADYDKPFYLVSMIPIGKTDTLSVSLGGTGLTNSFATFVGPGTQLSASGAAPSGSGPTTPAKGGSGTALVKLLLHEMFHEWNGRVLQREAPEERMYWFSEGFTDFYTRRLAMRGGWIDARDFTDDVNAKIREYYTSTERGADAPRIEAMFFKDRSVRRQPYTRGDLLACVVDQAIRRRTHGRQSLDDFMRTLVTSARTGKDGTLRISNDSLFARIEKWAGKGTARTVRSVALEGADLKLPADLFAPALKQIRGEAGRFDLGFDLDASRATHVITGVREGSAGWKAGLRDGQKLLGASVWYDRPDREAAFDVEIEGVRRKVSYLPIAGAIRVPLYELVPSRANLLPFGSH